MCGGGGERHARAEKVHVPKDVCGGGAPLAGWHADGEYEELVRFFAVLPVNDYKAPGAKVCPGGGDGGGVANVERDAAGGVGEGELPRGGDCEHAKEEESGRVLAEEVRDWGNGVVGLGGGGGGSSGGAFCGAGKGRGEERVVAEKALVENMVAVFKEKGFGGWRGQERWFGGPVL